MAYTDLGEIKLCSFLADEKIWSKIFNLFNSNWPAAAFVLYFCSMILIWLISWSIASLHFMHYNRSQSHVPFKNLSIYTASNCSSGWENPLKITFFVVAVVNNFKPSSWNFSGGLCQKLDFSIISCRSWVFWEQDVTIKSASFIVILVA